MNNLSGYLGLYKFPFTNHRNYKDSVYVIKDEMTRELNLFILSPEACFTAFELAKANSFQYINIFSVSYDELFHSSIANLIRCLAPIKEIVKFIYPVSPYTNSSSIVEASHIKSMSAQTALGSVVVQYSISTDIMANSLYDISIQDSKKHIVICPYMYEDKMKSLHENTHIDEIHVPFSMPIYGGMTFSDIIKVDKKYREKVVMALLNNNLELDYCKRNNIRTGEVIYSDFV